MSCKFRILHFCFSIFVGFDREEKLENFLQRISAALLESDKGRKLRIFNNLIKSEIGLIDLANKYKTLEGEDSQEIYNETLQQLDFIRNNKRKAYYTLHENNLT